MNIFAISDLHLSGNPPSKPMKKFGNHWESHWEKIQSSWLNTVTGEDVILIPGDISWAMKFEEALIDLNELNSLPGQKILVRGNHDYWWQTITKMRNCMGPKFQFLQNSYISYSDWAICGSRGWIYPSDPTFKAGDNIIYQRELLRVEASLKSALSAGFSKIILLLHYPPFIFEHPHSGFKDLIDKYGVALCVYGHLHGASINSGPQHVIGQTEYILVSCDALNFTLKKIITV